MPSPSPSRLVCLLLAGLILAAAGCSPAPARRAASGNPGWALTDAPPDDFTLSLTVYPPDPAAAQVSPLPRYLRASRALVQPDLTLRAAEGPATPQTYPPLTRALAPAQYRRLWWDLRDSGLLKDRHPAEVASPAAAAPPAGAPPPRGLYIITYVAAGHHRTLALDPLLGEDAPGARRLVDRIADLAWFR